MRKANLKEQYKRLKKQLSSNYLLRVFISFILMLYLRLVYFTTRWIIVNPEGKRTRLNPSKQTIICAWHNKAAIMPFILRRVKRFYALASSHQDGMIIARILRFFLIKVIYGSTNRNAANALRRIISILKEGGNIGITPDGPRGPIYKINSNLCGAARITDAEIIAVGSYISRNIILKSWDKFIFPLPFSKGVFVIDYPIQITKDMDITKINVILEQRLNLMDSIAENLAK